MPNIKPALFPGLLFFLSFILRLSLISKGPYNVDCLGLVIAAEKTLRTGQLSYVFGFGYPLTVLLGAASILLFKVLSIQDPVLALNFMSVLFSALCVPFFYLITQKLFDGLTALFSATLLSVCPLFLGVSVYGKSHAPALFFLLAGLYFLLRYKEKQKIRDLFLSSLLIGAIGAARFQDLFLVLIPLSLFSFGTILLKTVGLASWGSV